MHSLNVQCRATCLQYAACVLQLVYGSVNFEILLKRELSAKIWGRHVQTTQSMSHTVGGWGGGGGGGGGANQSLGAPCNILCMMCSPYFFNYLVCLYLYKLVKSGI